MKLCDKCETMGLGRCWHPNMCSCTTSPKPRVKGVERAVRLDMLEDGVFFENTAEALPELRPLWDKLRLALENAPGQYDQGFADGYNQALVDAGDET